MLQHKKFLILVTEVVSEQLSSGCKGALHSYHCRGDLLWKVKVTANNRQELWADFILCWIVMLGLDLQPTKATFFVKMSQWERDGHNVFILWCAQLNLVLDFFAALDNKAPSD